MNIDKIAFTPDIAPTDWVPSNTHRTKNPCPRTLARWRAKARAKWPTYQPDVAYAIEGGTAAEDATRANLAGVLPRRGLGRHHPWTPAAGPTSAYGPSTRSPSLTSTPS